MLLFRITSRFVSMWGRHWAVVFLSVCLSVFCECSCVADPHHPSPPACLAPSSVQLCLLAFQMRPVKIQGRRTIQCCIRESSSRFTSSAPLVPKMCFNRSTGPEPERVTAGTSCVAIYSRMLMIGLIQLGNNWHCNVYHHSTSQRTVSLCGPLFPPHVF